MNATICTTHSCYRFLQDDCSVITRHACIAEVPVSTKCEVIPKQKIQLIPRGSSFITDSAVMDLPQPDSPTMQCVSPRPPPTKRPPPPPSPPPWIPAEWG